MSSEFSDPSSTIFISSTPATGAAPAPLPSQPSSMFLSSTASIGIQSSDFIAAQNESHPQATGVPSSTHHSQIQPPHTRKRKACAMLAKKWKPAENRIKELWIDEEKPLEELQDIVNSEFGFTASIRQYKAQIKRMKLEKNAKADERRSIVRHLKYREHKGKNTKHVRIRDHEIVPAKTIRWTKEHMSPSPLSSPSPLPSYISVLTGSPSPSPVMMQNALSPNNHAKARSTSPLDGFNEAIQKLFACANDESVMSQEAGHVLKALQLLLGCERRTRKFRESWDTFSEEHIACFRNLQVENAQKIDIHREWKRAHGDGLEIRNPRRRFDRHATWWTAYGMVQISFATRSNVTHNGSWQQENLQPMNEVLATRIGFFPNRTLHCPFAAVLDFSPNHDPFARLTYQATIPNESLIFEVASAGNVDGLIQMLEAGEGRLSDRDEEGRSLLNYSLQNSRVSMTKFLLQKGQDPDSPEVDELGFPSILHGIGPLLLQVERPFEERNRSTECHKLMVKADADLSPAGFFDGTSWVTNFQLIALSCQAATFEHILKLGKPFVSPNTEFLDDSGNTRSVLSYLTQYCGYACRGVIQIVDKAILLLKGKADIAYRDADGDTVLHTLLSGNQAHKGSYTLVLEGARNVRASYFFFSLTEPRLLLIVFLSAGADVYAENKKGETPSSVAKQYDREDEWNEALKACGYNHKEVWAHTELGSFGDSGKRQSSRLSFEDVCRKRQEYLKFKEQFFEEHCRTCKEPFVPSLVSFSEKCDLCGEKFRYKEEPLDSQYEPLREQYLQEKDTLTKYCLRRVQNQDEELLRFKRAAFEERCRGCGCQFQPEVHYLPERCLQCGAKIRRKRVLLDKSFDEIAAHYRKMLWLGKQLEILAHQCLDGDDETDWGEDNSSDYGSDLDDGSDLDHDSDMDYSIASDEAEDFQANHSDLMTYDAEMADPNMDEGPRTEPKQMSSQAMDLDDTEMDIDLATPDSGWVASLTEAPTDNQVVDAVGATDANAAAEEFVFQSPFIPANDESPSRADSNEFGDLFDYNEYFEEA